MTNLLQDHLSPSAYSLIASLNTPDLIQDYIDHHIQYDPVREDRCVEAVVQDGLGECYNGALFGVACLRAAGYKSSIIELYARGGDEEHILGVYKLGEYFGCVAQSKFLGLKSRRPIYPTVRDLAVSYMEYYFSYDGKYSLQSYTDLFPLENYAEGWLIDNSTVVKIGKDLRAATHHALAELDDPYYYVTPDRYWKEMLYIPPGITIPDHYLAAKPAHIDLASLHRLPQDRK